MFSNFQTEELLQVEEKKMGTFQNTSKMLKTPHIRLLLNINPTIL